MPNERDRGGWRETLLGMVVLIAVMVGTYSAIHAVYKTYFSPAPATISLAAYFVDDAGVVSRGDAPGYERSHLKVKGDVFQGGQPVKSGTVRLTVTIAKDDLFRQSISISFQNGHFETEDPAFRAVRPGSSVEIRADAVAPGIAESATIYLNSEAPVDKSTLEYVSASVAMLLSVAFFVAFTGRKRPWKNQMAIIFSYVVIAIFLAVPILAPMLLIRTFPNAVDAMIGTPAGLVNTHTSNQPENETQWALNIGGYSFRAETAEGTVTDKITSNPPAAAPATLKQPTPQSAERNSDGTNSGSTIGNQIPASASGKLSTAPEASSTTVRRVSTPAQSQHPEPLAPVVKVQGGLVIPLYVIILSVFGGAINMTRKVPSFQKEGEESDFSVTRPISRVGTAVLNLARVSAGQSGAAAIVSDETTPGPAADTANAPNQAPPGLTPAAQIARPDATLEARAKAIDDELAPLLATQIKVNSETDTRLTRIRTLVGDMQNIYQSRSSDEPILNFKSFEDWAASYPRLAELLRGGWRVELLNQYMYLISAPFLAIVTYYILDLLGLSKQGVIVVLSFSVGLVSERIVSWILGIASGYLRSESASAMAKKA